MNDVSRMRQRNRNAQYSTLAVMCHCRKELLAENGVEELRQQYKPRVTDVQVRRKEWTVFKTIGIGKDLCFFSKANIGKNSNGKNEQSIIPYPKTSLTGQQVSRYRSSVRHCNIP